MLSAVSCWYDFNDLKFNHSLLPSGFKLKLVAKNTAYQQLFSTCREEETVLMISELLSVPEQWL